MAGEQHGQELEFLARTRVFRVSSVLATGTPTQQMETVPVQTRSSTLAWFSNLCSRDDRSSSSLISLGAVLDIPLIVHRY